MNKNDILFIPKISISCQFGGNPTNNFPPSQQGQQQYVPLGTSPTPSFSQGQPSGRFQGLQQQNFQPEPVPYQGVGQLQGVQQQPPLPGQQTNAQGQNLQPQPQPQGLTQSQFKPGVQQEQLQNSAIPSFEDAINSAGNHLPFNEQMTQGGFSTVFNSFISGTENALNQLLRLMMSTASVIPNAVMRILQI